MDTIENIKKTISQNQTKYCEFITCLINHGNSELLCDQNEKNEFYYFRDFEDLGFSDLFISYSAQDYLYHILEERVQESTNIVSILPADEKCAEELLHAEDFQVYCNQKGWDIKLRHQFYQNSAEHTEHIADHTDGTIVKLDSTHKPLIEKSESDRVKLYYESSMHMQGFGESYGIIVNHELVSYLSVCKLLNDKFPLAEINWIYTEQPFRNQGFAVKLLQNTCPMLTREGYTVTYHCDSGNAASKKTALKAKLRPDQDEIILERK